MDHEYEILQRFKKGDEAALSYILNSLKRVTTSVVQKIVRDWDQTEDIVMESFVKLWNHRDDIKSWDHLKNWLIRVAKNAAIDHKRYTLQSEDLYDEIPIDDREIVLAEYMGLLFSFYKDLPEKQKHIFRMHFIQRKSAHEISKELNAAPQTVANRISTLRKKIKKI